MPEGMREFKRRETLFYVRFTAASKSLFRAIFSLPRRFFRWARQGLTVALIPHTGRPSSGIRTNRFTLLVAGLALAGLLGFALYGSLRYAALAARYGSLVASFGDSSRAIDELKNGTDSLASSALGFESSLSGFLDVAQSQTVGARRPDDALRAAGLADLLSSPKAASQEGAVLLGASDSVIYGSTVQSLGSELDRLAELASYLDKARPEIDKAASLLAGQKDVMTEIPNIWPIRGGLGHVSMYFGQNENPFSAGQWYIHNGIDISTFRSGDAILATADGKVIDAGYNSSFGNFITVQHSHGFLTRYAHLRTIRVSKGQKVAQGQLIGTLGNTGKSTGPHLHYEVHLGTSVIDPLRFLNIRRTAAK